MQQRRILVFLLALVLIILGSVFGLLPFLHLLSQNETDCIVPLAVTAAGYAMAIFLIAYEVKSQASVPTKRKSRRKTRVVAIDDEEDILRLIRIKLSKEGFRVITAKDGVEGIETVLDKHPDVMLVDIMMPQKDGYEVVSEVKKKMGENAPVAIMLTSKSEEEDMMEGLASGADDYITKPFSPTELIERINVALLKGQKSSENKAKK
ncbi:MAG: response regulator [Candidatus Lokiarchaeota archaeon]|nr:response regulator [Candidatus Lokiarchaeota archaeon]